MDAAGLCRNQVFCCGRIELFVNVELAGRVFGCLVPVCFDEFGVELFFRPLVQRGFDNESLDFFVAFDDRIEAAVQFFCGKQSVFLDGSDDAFPVDLFCRGRR